MWYLGLLGLLVLSSALSQSSPRLRAQPRIRHVGGYVPTPTAPSSGQTERVTRFCRDGLSLIYLAACPAHCALSERLTSEASLAFDLETGMAHCFWCGWGGRVAKPLVGPVHPDMLPHSFQLVLHRKLPT